MKMVAAGQKEGKRLPMVGSMVAALIFGMLAALVKGDHYGLRDTIGNLSTPWLLVAFVPGFLARSLPRGAVLGLAATAAALLGFYVMVTVTVDGQLEHVLRHNGRWLFCGLVSGPAMGVFGAWLRRWAADPVRAGVLVTALLLVLEPVVIWSARIVPGWREVVHWTLDPWPYVAEALVGIFLLVRRALTVMGEERPGRRPKGPAAFRGSG